MKRRGRVYGLDNLRAVVTAYLTDYRDCSEEERHVFASQPTLAEAVRLAGLAQGREGKRMSHQRRIPGTVLRQAADRLRRRLPALKGARSFERLHDVVHATIGRIHGIGDLTIYDTAIRIGARLGLAPKRVYLHAGTRDGARALGVSRDRDWVMPRELPRAFRRLRPMEIEDCLCIFKAALRQLMDGKIGRESRRRRTISC